MNLEQIIKRIKTIKTTIQFDNDKEIEIIIDNYDMLNHPGLNIQTINTLLGRMIGNPIETYCEENPIETEMQKALNSREYKLSSYTFVDTKENTIGISLYEVNSMKSKYFEYQTYADAYDDLEFCKKKFNY